MNLTDVEFLVPDERLERLRSMITFRYPDLAGYEVATYIQPERETETGVVPPLAVFLFITPHPQHPEQQLTSTATCRLEDWRAAEWEREHYVGAPDPLKQFILALARQQNKAVQSLKELIN